MLVAVGVENARLANSLNKYLVQHFEKQGLHLEFVVTHRGDRIPVIKTGLPDIFRTAFEDAKRVRREKGAAIGIGLAMGPMRLRMRSGAREVRMDALVICSHSKHFITAVIPDHMHPKEWDKDLSDELDTLAGPHTPRPEDYDDALVIEVGYVAAQIVGYILRFDEQSLDQSFLN